MNRSNSSISDRFDGYSSIPTTPDIQTGSSSFPVSNMNNQKVWTQSNYQQNPTSMKNMASMPGSSNYVNQSVNQVVNQTQIIGPAQSEAIKTMAAQLSKSTPSHINIKKERKREDLETPRDAKIPRKVERIADPEIRKLKCHQGGTYKFSMSKLLFR